MQNYKNVKFKHPLSILLRKTQATKRKSRYPDSLMDSYTYS